VGVATSAEALAVVHDDTGTRLPDGMDARLGDEGVFVQAIAS
jgi:hypothetical protein